MSPLRGRVESLAYGAHGVARIDGKVYFVRGAAPGDEVEIEVREEHRSYAFADIVSLLQPGEARRVPPCEYLPRCGGCPWQHLSEAAQAEAKQALVADLLRRVGRIEAPPVLPILTPGKPLGYRRRLSLRVEGGVVGYFAGGSHDLVAVEHCLLAAPELEGALPLAQEWVSLLATRIKRVEIAGDGGGGLVFAAQAEGALGRGDAEATAQLRARRPQLRGVSIHGRGWRQSWGDPRVRVEVTGETLDLPAGSFVQVNDQANAVLVRAVLDYARCGGEDEVLDLYAGFGNLSFPLARRARRVTAVERDGESVRAGERHARERGDGRVSFVAADVATFLRAAVRRVDIAVLDPPRSGAAEAIEPLLRLAPRRIVYVSCNPSTLARDLHSLAPRYRLVRVQPIDFFPQTYHVEAVAEIELTDT